MAAAARTYAVGGTVSTCFRYDLVVTLVPRTFTCTKYALPPRRMVLRNYLKDIYSAVPACMAFNSVFGVLVSLTSWSPSSHRTYTTLHHTATLQAALRHYICLQPQLQQWGYYRGIGWYSLIKAKSIRTSHWFRELVGALLRYCCVAMFWLLCSSTPR